MNHLRLIGGGDRDTRPSRPEGCEHPEATTLVAPELHDVRERAYDCVIFRPVDGDGVRWRRVGVIRMRPLCPKPFLPGAVMNYKPIAYGGEE